MRSDKVVSHHFQAPSITSNEVNGDVFQTMFSLANVPEFQRFIDANPGKTIDAYQTAMMYGRAILG